MTKIPHFDNLLIYIIPEDTSGEKLAPIDTMEDYQLERGHVALRKEISPSLCTWIIYVLKEHQDTFAYEGETLTQINRQIVTHKLNVDLSFPARCQKRQMLNLIDRRPKSKVSKLLKAGHIQEVRYSQWMANLVLVKKPSGGKWWMCIDFTILNKACPKDSYPLPPIDELINGASNSNILSMMKAHSGNNQIFMHK